MVALLTPDTARARGLEADLPDSALQEVLDECDALVVQRHGPHYDADTPLVLVFRNHQSERHLYVRRPIASVSEIVELDREHTLETDDYEVENDGSQILRLYGGDSVPGGNTGYYYWDWHVRITYLPEDDNLLRRKMTFDLAQLYMADNKLASERVGDYTMHSRDIEREQKRILRQLRYNSIGILTTQQWEYGE